MPKKHAQSNKTRKRKGKDLDQIFEDLKPEKAAKIAHQEIDLDLPGQCDGQFYCIECNRYFIDQQTIDKHKTSKVHRKRLKLLRDQPYTQKEAEIAGGLGV